MSVAPLVTKPSQAQRKISPSKQPPRIANNLKKLPLPQKQLSAKLQFLLFIHKVVSVVTFCLVGTTLGMYAWTVYFPKLWSDEYRKLGTLQNYERHITATNETLKNQLAQQAENPKMGLTNPSPTQSIFLNPTSDVKQRPQDKPSAKADAMPTASGHEVRRSLANAY